MLKSRRWRVSCLVAAAGLAVVAVRPSLVVADADSALPSVAVPVGGETHASLFFAVPAVVATDFGVLVDGTGSQSENLAQISAMLTGVFDAASVGNPSVRVGLATSGDVPLFPFGIATDAAYRLQTQFTGDRLVWGPALQTLQAVEGGGDDQEGQLPAILALLNSASEDPVRRSMTYDAAARRLLIVSADSPPHVVGDSFCQNDVCTPYPGPSEATVQSMLDQAGVTVIVLARGDVGVLASIAAASGGSTIDAATPEAAATLAQAIEIAPVVIRPMLRGCEGLAVRVDKQVRAKPGETVSVPVVVSALAGATEGTRTCSVAFSGVQQSVSITVAKPCDTTPTSEAPTTTTTTVATVTTLVGGSPTTVAGEVTTTAAPATTTEVPATTTSEPPASVVPTTTESPTTTAVAPTSAPPASSTDVPAASVTPAPAEPVVPTEAPASTSPSAPTPPTAEPPGPSTTVAEAAGPNAVPGAAPSSVPPDVVPGTSPTTTVVAPSTSGPCLAVTTTIPASATTVAAAVTTSLPTPVPLPSVPVALSGPEVALPPTTVPGGEAPTT